MPLLFEHIGEASRSLKSNRARTLLTTLGITIGIASITAVLSLSSGIMGVISRQVSSLEGNLILVRPGVPIDTPQVFLTTPPNQQQFGTSTLTEEDITAISSTEGVEAVAPLMTISSNLKSETTTLPGLIVATSPSLADIAHLEVRDGQFIDSVTNPNTAVIGAQTAINLFGTEKPIGQTFTARGQLFTVIGILKRTNDPINFNSIDFDNAVVISIEAGKNFYNGRAQIQQIDIKADSAAIIPEVTTRINQELEKNHKGERDFTTVSGQDIVLPTNQVFIAIAGVMTAIAAISLVVGGIGIMNIMLVGVAERTREIGLRKAIGASNRNILSQFLTESLLMSLTGGITGYILGYLVAFGISQFLTFNPALSWEVAVVALCVSLVTGVIFGLYPAIRAARKNPIESLRQYQ